MLKYYDEYNSLYRANIKEKTKMIEKQKSFTCINYGCQMSIQVKPK